MKKVRCQVHAAPNYVSRARLLELLNACSAEQFLRAAAPAENYCCLSQTSLANLRSSHISCCLESELLRHRLRHNTNIIIIISPGFTIAGVLKLLWTLRVPDSVRHVEHVISVPLTGMYLHDAACHYQRSSSQWQHVAK